MTRANLRPKGAVCVIPKTIERAGARTRASALLIIASSREIKMLKPSHGLGMPRSGGAHQRVVEGVLRDEPPTRAEREIYEAVYLDIGGSQGAENNMEKPKPPNMIHFASKLPRSFFDLFSCANFVAEVSL
jgi:hypothetical protein